MENGQTASRELKDQVISFPQDPGPSAVSGVVNDASSCDRVKRSGRIWHRQSVDKREKRGAGQQEAVRGSSSLHAVTRQSEASLQPASQPPRRLRHLFTPRVGSLVISTGP